MELPENFSERFGRIEQRLDDIWTMHTTNGCASHQKLSSRVDGVFLAGAIVTAGFCGWIGWLTLTLI